MSLLTFPIKDFFSRLYEKAFDEDIFSSAAQVAFYFSFAIFPLLLFLISLIGLVLSSADDLRSELFYYLRQIMPYSAFELVQTTIKEVTEGSSGGKLTLGFFIALWSASAGIDSIRIALNSVYNLKEKRSWWKTKLLSLTFTFVITILISIALAIVFYGWKFISFILGLMSLPIPEGLFLVLIQWSAVLVVLFLVFDLLYNFIPSHSPIKWKWVTPGAIVGIILWLFLSFGFRLYLNYYNTYSKMYGSLGAVIILMLWLYLTSLVILIGGLINSILTEMSQTHVTIKNEIKAETPEDLDNQTET
jgi:membrane protein